MKKNPILSIIIPSKNEQEQIEDLFISLIPQISQEVEIILSDADSKDKTVEIAKSYYKDLKVIKGGLPSIGRNNGAKVSDGEYLLFLDADMYISSGVISHVIKTIKTREVELLTCKIKSKEGGIYDILYILNNFLVRLSKLDGPFVVGGFFLIKKSTFMKLGKFDESVMHCEDYMLSRQISAKNFYIINRNVYTSSRRIKEMGFWGMVKYFIKNIKNRKNVNYFRNDIKYWKK